MITFEPKGFRTKHDTVFKMAMSDLHVAKAMIQDYLPNAITQHLDLSSLTICKSTYIDQELKHSHSDMLYKLKDECDEDAYVYFLWEHQSTYDQRIALRLLSYIINILQDHVNQGNQKLPVVIPALIYNGKQSPYPGSSDFYAAFANSDFAKKTMFQSFTLVDLSVKSNEELMTSQWSALPNLILKHMRARDFLREVESQIQSLICFLNDRNGKTILENMLQCIMRFTNIADRSDFIKVVTETSASTGEKLMTIYEQLLSEGRMEGLQEGRQEGRYEAQIEMRNLFIRNLILDGFDNARISKLASVSIAEVKKLRAVVEVTA